MNITQLLELQAISIAGDVIHKTIAMLHHVTNQVQHKDNYHRKHSVLAISSNRHIKALVSKRALKERLNNPNWLTMDGKNFNITPSPL